MDKLKELFTKAVKSLECGACVAALVGAKDVAYLNKNWVLDAAAGLCSEFKVMPKDVCTGLVYSQGPVLIEAMMQASLLSGDGKYFCFQALGACPAPGVTSGSLTFPKPKPANATAPTHSGTLVDVLHLSDWHVDNEYVPGSEGDCNRPLCCRKYADSPLTPKRAASTWGDYKCDSPIKLGQDLLKHVPKVANPNFTILTGDIPPHDIWLQNKDSVIAVEEIAYSTMQAGLSSKVYPTVGNHETGPTNLFPTPSSGGDIKWLYNSLADDWSRWLPADATNSVKNYGAYTVTPAPGLRLISLNTNFCYTLNFYLYGNTKEYDPHGELKWLVAQLQKAEDAGERVWIISHVGPSQTDCLQNWSALYYQVIQRYSPHVIAEQFFGHTHYDEFALYYGPGAKSTQSAISTGWIGPSVAPYTNINPGFRIYKVDTKSWNVFDSETYIADLEKAAEWDAAGTTPNWHLEYSARKAYGAYVPIADNAPLSASWWHNVTTVFEKNDAAFQQYWTYRGKSANRQAACTAGGPCPKEIICNLRAGKSSDACTAIKFSVSKREDGNDTTVDEDDVSGLHSLYKREDYQPWNTKLCGLSSQL
ncbi:MAG: Metallo-dependent phosphatase-like protein [Benniella sp.]|nr:MAG: Metallo-dependent phosphatase-like protein [Benniella sp.]